MKSFRLYLSIFALTVCCLLTLLAQPAHAFPSYPKPTAAGYNLLLGTWRGRDQRVVTITPETYNGTAYTITSVRSDGFTTVIIFTLDGGHTLSWTVPHGNLRYAMMNDLTTGRFSDAMDFLLQ